MFFLSCSTVRGASICCVVASLDLLVFFKSQLGGVCRQCRDLVIVSSLPSGSHPLASSGVPFPSLTPDSCSHTRHCACRDGCVRLRVWLSLWQRVRQRVGRRCQPWHVQFHGQAPGWCPGGRCRSGCPCHSRGRGAWGSRRCCSHCKGSAGQGRRSRGGQGNTRQGWCKGSGTLLWITPQW